MSSTTKPQKDKPHGCSPRLIPRPTAASAARAARNACNRNLATMRQSPSRTATAYGPGKEKCQTARTSISQKKDTKLEENTPLAARDEITNVTVVVTEVKEALKEDKENIKDDKEHMKDDDNTILQEMYDLNFLETIQNGVEILQRKECDHLPGLEATEAIDKSSGKQTPSSRPTTPKRETTSRLQTPKSAYSRPQTPRSAISQPRSIRSPQTPGSISSRPVTPVNPHMQHPSTRPTTPQRICTRPATPDSLVNAPPSRPKTPFQPTCIKDDIKSTFELKQKQFNKMKMELDLKQQATLEVYEALKSIRERMCREGLSGSGEGPLQELVMFNVGDWTADEVSRLCRDAATSSLDSAVELFNTTIPIDDCALQDLDARVTAVPTLFADLCLQAFTARQELIDWIKDIVQNNILKESEDGGEGCMERVNRYNAQGLKMCEALRELKNQADDAIDTVTQLSRRACRERCALIAVGESLVREVARLRHDIETHVANFEEMHEATVEAETAKALEEIRRELEEERAARAVSKDKLATTESQLRQAHNRIAKMDRQLREAEASITSLSATVKGLEDQNRQKEVQLEARARKLKESLKTREITNVNLVQQRDALQAEVNELKAHIATLTTQHKSAIQELTNQLNETKSELEAQKRTTEAELELKRSAELALAESMNLVEELKAKIQEMEINKPNPDLPTEREMDLWAELQATKETLQLTEEEVNACKREKVRFLETLTKIAESENKVGLQHKLAGELINKEEVVAKLQTQIRQLTKNAKLNEQKVIQYEQYVRDLQEHNRNVSNCLESTNDNRYEDLLQEIMSLKMKLVESVHRNEELSEILVQKEQQIEQQDKTAKAQTRVIKIREELINMLKNKETEQSRELTALQQDLEHRMKIVEEVNKQIAAKANEIQELFSTLESKQQQIHRLEKIVVALEEQQRRAQAQRVRHEQKISALEHELAANRAQRKFLFF